MHLLNQMRQVYSDVKYKVKDVEQNCWFEFPKNIKNNILIEMNINALNEIYPLNQTNFKDSIGSLNLKKFAERIKTQLKENETLTQGQRNSMNVNGIVSLVRANCFDEAKALLDKTQKQPQFQNSVDQAMFRSLQVHFFIKDKKYQEALGLLPAKAEDMQTLFLRCQLQLNLKNQQACVDEMITYYLANEGTAGILIPIILRLASNYRLLDSEKLKQFVHSVVKIQLSKSNVDSLDFKLLQALILAGQSEEALKLIEKCPLATMKKDKKVLSLYLSLAPGDKTAQMRRELETMTPTDLFDAKKVEEEGLTEEDCIQLLLDAAMPEKVKEKKTTNVTVKAKGGAEIFMPSAKKKNKRVKYPKDFDASNPGQTPDPERWLPKWQRSRFKKLAKKKGIYLKGAQGDAQIDTDVTTGYGAKSTAHRDAAQGGGKRRKK